MAMKSVPLLLAGYLLVPVVAHADYQVIKLTCELDVTVYPPFGAPTKSHETDDVEVDVGATTGFRAISITSNAIPINVTNGRGGAITAFVDNSDDNRWDISSDRQRAGSLTKESVAIDRNTGRLTAYSMLTVGDHTLREEASGICTKVDTTKRKF
jgi:hypothetical protein